jgi:HlyD family secretion protein
VGALVKVGSRASGVVEHLYVRIGDTVRRGQLLADLDTRDLAARRDQAAAALAAASAMRAFARSDLERRRALGAAGLLPAADLELAERGHAVAEQQWSEAAASLDFARTQLGYSRITAPIAGVVSSVATQEGETVAASLAAPTFVTLVDLARLEVWAYVDETDIGRIRKGQAARFTVDSWPDHEFAGRLTAIYPQAEIRDNVVNYVAVVTFEADPERTLRPEMTATVRVVLDAREDVLALPRAALRRDASGTWARLASGEKRAVSVGRRDDTNVEIVAGLREGDLVRVGEPAAKSEE